MSRQPLVAGGRFFDSLRWNFMLLGGLGLLAIFALGVALSQMGRGFLLDAQRRQLSAAEALVGHCLEDLGDDPAALQAELDRIKALGDYRVTVVAADGAVLADNEADPRLMENHGNRPEVRAALRGGTGFAIRFSHTLNEDMLYLARPRGGGVLRVAMSLASLSDLLQASLAVSLAAVGCAALVMVAVSWRMYRGIIIPVNRILDAAAAGEQAGSGARFHVSKPLELAAISRSLRQMASDLNREIAQSRQREQELERLFEAIREPVLVLDRNQVVRSANAAAEAFIRSVDDRTGDLAGKHLLTHLRCSELAALIQESGRLDRPVSGRATLYGTTPISFGAYAAPMDGGDPEGGKLYILVLYLEG